MIIGLDIDDVIFDTSDVIRGILSESENEELIPIKLDVMRGDASIPAVAKFLKRYLIVAVKEGKVKPGAAEVMRRLRAGGNKIVLITARGEKNFPGTKVANEKALKDAGVEWDLIVYDSADKVEACRENDVEVFVDDSPRNCMEVKRELKIPVIGFESEITRDRLHEVGVVSVGNWADLEKRILEFEK